MAAGGIAVTGSGVLQPSMPVTKGTHLIGVISRSREPGGRTDTNASHCAPLAADGRW